MKKWMLPCYVLLLPVLAAAEVGDLTHRACKASSLGSSRPNIKTVALATPPSPTNLVHPDALAQNMELPNQASVFVAIDGETKDAKILDVLRLDFTGDGTFNDAVRVKLDLSPAKEITTGNRYYFGFNFGPLPVVLRINGADFPTMLRGSYRPSAVLKDGKIRPPCVSIHTNLAVQGVCQFDQKTHAIRIFDRDDDGRCGHPAKPLDNTPFTGQRKPFGDTFMIDFGDGSFGGTVGEYYWGQPFCVDDKWYELKLSEDGKKVQAIPLEGTKSGRIALTAPKWELILTGKDSFLHIFGGPQGAAVPVGEYYLTGLWEWSAPDAQGRCARIEYGPYATEKMVVVEGKETHVFAGEPIHAKIHVGRTSERKGQKKISLKMKVQSQHGALVEDIRPFEGENLAEPKIEVVDASGKTVLQANLHYG